MSGNGQESTAQHEEQERKQREFNHQVAERSTDMAHAMDRARDVGGVIHDTYDREMYSREGASVRDIALAQVDRELSRGAVNGKTNNYGLDDLMTIKKWGQRAKEMGSEWVCMGMNDSRVSCSDHSAMERRA